MIENIQDELYQLEKQTSKRYQSSCEHQMGTGLQKMLQNFFSKHLKGGMCKIKQYLNYITDNNKSKDS